MRALYLLFNGHAGSGLGEILIAIAIGALAITVAIYTKLYRRWPSSLLRILGLFYIGVIIANLALTVTIFPGALILLAYLIIFTSVPAVVVWLIHLAIPRRV